MTGAFVISLDFELYWGVRGSMSMESYGPNILGARKAIPRLLSLFREYEISATFATVGMLFFGDKEALRRNLPTPPVEYEDPLLNWYPDYFEKLGRNEAEDPYHFGQSLVQQIRADGRHEIATHTFSHCYALEAKRSPSAFAEELHCAIEVARECGVTIESIVFPRNQYDADALAACKALGIKGFRGNERSWMYEPKSRDDDKPVRRLARLTDSYVNVTGHHTYGWDELAHPSGLYNIPASRFLRPFEPRLSALDARRLARITSAMTYAATHGRIYHLWWHPHNFGVNTDENLTFLRSILDHYQRLEQRAGFSSLTMRDCYSVVSASAATREPRVETAAAL